ncbi:MULTISPECIES: glycoside hydrolase family 10 protein [Pseudothermotoga]|uniref:Glycosyl hydrolase-like 10 domain-containing protein n=1 Tax=Pseudothermotoga lettingae (strain ATCC BAA-301 / DSM 14385 / NBRC 107922 / TMO) TaxID=416591 RepID=A8F7H3_PSELT|nr:MULTISPECIES: hypothetical protein [Pseudothermotoga]ABV34107.1 hypothetical protein Tlet_1551 [Pseudothermotoga lettingae TMO]MDK2884733.1 hypothetical protein [Pseudothermotoga sp.]GLI48953.1 hypothetical protein PLETTINGATMO_11220 [Pseudothermotoga lettingae TMO]
MKKGLILIAVGLSAFVLTGCFVIANNKLQETFASDDVLMLAETIAEQVDMYQRLPEACEKVWQAKGKVPNSINLNDASYAMAKYTVELLNSNKRPSGVPYIQTALPSNFEAGDFELESTSSTCTMSDFRTALSWFASEIEKNKILPSVVPININGSQRKISIDVFIATVSKILKEFSDTGKLPNDVILSKALLPFSWPAKIKAVWVWGSTLANLGVENTLQQLKEIGFTDILLLVKGTSGTVNWPSQIALGFSSDTTVLPRASKFCRTSGLRLHVWFVCNQDQTFTSTYPESKMYGIPKTVDGDPQRAGKTVDFVGFDEYREYMESLIREVMEDYKPDGLHFDYIRYPTGAWGWGPAEIQTAMENGLTELDIQYLKNLAIQTWGTNGDNQSFINAYISGDATVTKWVEIRSKIVQKFLQDLSSCAKQVKSDVIISAALMPEPASLDSTEKAFGLVHYGQNYAIFSDDCEMIVPMAYHRDYGKDSSWITEEIFTGARQQIQANTKLVLGLQGYSPVTGDELAQIINDCIDKNAEGICVFRAGTILNTEIEEALRNTFKEFK